MKGIKAQCHIRCQSALAIYDQTAFPEIDSFKKPYFRRRRKTGEPGEKPLEAIMAWKPNARTAPGPPSMITAPYLHLGQVKQRDGIEVSNCSMTQHWLLVCSN